MIFILGTLISGAISIRRATEITDMTLRHRMPAVTTVDWDSDKALEYRLYHGELPVFNAVTIEHLKEISNLPYVVNYDFSIRSFAYSRNLERICHLGSGNCHLSTAMVLPELEGIEILPLRGVFSPNILDV